MGEKIICPECGRKLNTKHFVQNPVKKILICRRCDKKIGHNIFYKKDTIFSKYKEVMSDDEKKALARQLIATGLTYENAWRRVRRRQGYLIWFEKNKRRKYKEKLEKIKEQEINNKEINKKFLEGLGQKK